MDYIDTEYEIITISQITTKIWRIAIFFDWYVVFFINWLFFLAGDITHRNIFLVLFTFCIYYYLIA